MVPIADHVPADVHARLPAEIAAIEQRFSQTDASAMRPQRASAKQSPRPYRRRAEPESSFAAAPVCSSTNTRIAEDRLVFWRVSSISETNFDSVPHWAAAIFFRRPQNASSRLTLVLCPPITTERFTTADLATSSSVILYSPLTHANSPLFLFVVSTIENRPRLGCDRDHKNTLCRTEG